MWKTVRPYVTPAATATALVVGLTGAMLFFHLGERQVKEMHEWFGIVSVLAVGAHVVRNLGPLQQYLRRGVALQVALGVAALASAGFLGASLLEDGGGRRPPGAFAVVQRLEQAELEQLAPVLGTDVEQLVARLQAEGFAEATPTTTVGGLASAHDRRADDLLALLVTP